MTVEQLIKRLQAFPPSSPVMINAWDGEHRPIANAWSFRPVRDWANPPGTVPFVVIDADKSQ